MYKSNQTGGKNHKKYKKQRGNNEEEENKALMIAGKGQVYGIIKGRFGGSRLSVLCHDDVLRSAIIPGKFYKKKKYRFEQNDVLLCDLMGGGDNKLCTVTYKYTIKESRKLKHLGHIRFEEISDNYVDVEDDEDVKGPIKSMYPDSDDSGSDDDSNGGNLNNDNKLGDTDSDSDSIDLSKL